MAIYVALLRGINVGGHKKVGMPTLKTMFESLGFGPVQTYINSGNVVFHAERSEEAETLVKRVEAAIERTFGFPVDVMIRTGAELDRIVEANPFAGVGSPADLNLHVGFMREIPAPDKLDKLVPYVNENDQFRLSRQELYVMFRAGVRDSKLGSQLNKLGVPVTLRNWNTTVKLCEIAASLKT